MSDQADGEDMDIASMRRERDGTWIGQLAPKKRASDPIIVAEPYREAVEPNDSGVQYIETMGVAVNPPDGEHDSVTISNTASGSSVSSRFCAFDVEMIDDVIRALEEVKRRRE